MGSEHRAEPLRSRFAGEAEMVELVQEFVQELPSRVEAMEGLMRASHFDDLRRTAHQLKGAAGGYGFPAISESAGAIENLLHASRGQPSLDEIRARVNELVGLCKRAVAS